MQSSILPARVRLAFSVGFLLVVLVAAASYTAIGQLISSHQVRVVADDGLVLIDRLSISIKTGEATLRQYLISGQEADLNTFQQARVVVRESLLALEGSKLMAEKSALDDLIVQRRAINNQAINARQNGDAVAASEVINSDGMRLLLARTDALLAQARARETASWQSAKVRAERSAKYAQSLIVAVGLLFAALLAWVIYAVHHYEKQRLRSEAQLRDSENMSRSITQGMVEGVITSDENDIILEANGAALQLFGYQKSDLIGRSVSDLLPERWRANRKNFMEYENTQTEPMQMSGREVTVMRKDGSEFLASVSMGDVRVGDRRLFTALIHDITDHKRVIDALQASESQLRQITDTVPALIGYVDKDQRFRFHNKAYEELLGLRREQIDGQTLADVLGPTIYASVQDKVEEVLSGYAVRYDRVHLTEQGSTRDFSMQYFPRYGEGEQEGTVIGFFSLGTDITELKRIDRMKTEFVSTVSHELRTPLTSIRGSLGLISGGVAGELPEGVKTLVGIAKNNCERLIRLINDILDSEKIESGKMPMNLQVMDLRLLAQQVVAANEGFAAQHQVRLVLLAGNKPLTVRIDSDRLTQVMTNLLSNAVKFSPSGGVVDIRLSRTDQRVRVELADQGSGIPVDFRSRIFQKFSQADSSDTRQKGGSGLGLNISRGLVERMGGRIGFDTTEGKGTTFYFEFPECKETVVERVPGIHPKKSDRGRVVDGQREPRILVCEDDADVAKLIGLMLAKAGFASDAVYSAEQALDLLARQPYDAVTVDLKMPGKSGLALIAALRRDPRTRDLPVVVISGVDIALQGRLRFQSKPLTVSDWLEKPIDEDQLVLSVRRAIKGLGGAKSRILHVEDDPDIQHIAAAIAAELAEFDFATSLEEARALLVSHRFDLVLLDLTLGDESGWDLFHEIDQLKPRPPVIVFSASDIDPVRVGQAEAVLVKAHTSNTQLLHTIQRLLQTAGEPGPTIPAPLI